MKTSVYVILSKNGVVGIRKGKPQLSSSQVSVKLNLTISDKFFERFVPEVELSIPDDYVSHPKIDVKLTGGAMDKLLGEEGK